MTWSLLIRNGSLIDGTGAPARRADVAVEGDRVVAVGSGLQGEARRVIDAGGHVVAPGFIDAHAHSDLFYFDCPAAESKLRQGCTTEVVGMCSFSPAPVSPASRDAVRAWAGGIGARLDIRWETFGQYLDLLRAATPSVNVVHFVGHGALRLATIGPENRSKIDRALALMDEARARGVDVWGDAYPYHAGSTKMDNLLPAWVHDGGVAKLLERIGDRATRRRIVEECLVDGERWGTAAMGAVGFDEIRIATCARRDLEGLTLAALARQTGTTPAEAMLNLLLAEKATVAMVAFSQSPDNVEKVLRHPAIMVGSDSIGLFAGGAPEPGKPHPRAYGTFPRVLGVYARDHQLFSLESAVHKMTGMPAARLRLRDRGRVHEGYAADLVVFDPATVKDEATFADPHRYPTGISHVIVNGDVVVDSGRFRAAGSGRVLTP